MADSNENERLERLEKGLEGVLDFLKGMSGKKDPEAEKKEVEVKKASPNKYTVNHEWDETAREIIGEAVDHTELEYLKGGGVLFTVVIKPEFTNASTEYLERHKVDRRSREVGSDGEAGVRIWCELIRSNLKRPKPVTIN